MGHKYIFTNKRESRKGIISTILGAVSLISLGAAVYQTFLNKGNALVKYGVIGLLALIFALAGAGLGVASKMEEDRFYLFSWVGIVLNLLSVAFVSFLLYAGAYGL